MVTEDEVVEDEPAPPKALDRRDGEDHGGSPRDVALPV